MRLKVLLKSHHSLSESLSLCIFFIIRLGQKFHLVVAGDDLQSADDIEKSSQSAMLFDDVQQDGEIIQFSNGQILQY